MATTKVLKAGRITKTKDGYLYERKIMYTGSNWLHLRLPFTLENGRVTITPKDGAEFMFKCSRPDVVYGIGGALKHIGKFADENVGRPNPVLSKVTNEGEQ